jgi:acetamidase/formamidase
MQTHRFQPDHYYTTLGPHQPVLHIEPGDQVITTTVDAIGRDASGEYVTGSGNPMTGPIYVNGAEPDDMLVLRLHRLHPNRSWGWSSWGVDPGTVDPWYAYQLAVPDESKPWEPAIWDIDTAQRTVILRSPETKLGRLCLPLEPMLGCFGVAPGEGETISTATSGRHGGNMDYRGFNEGVTIYLPVFVPGALVFVGDGHALQSDGEIAGTGIEVSMEVEFSVDLVKGKKIEWPRGENDIEIFTAGNARPLSQALQHATTAMLRWLREDYGLDPVSAGLLAGQAVRYEVGNVFDPAYTMVCKLQKSVLAQFNAAGKPAA